MPVICNKRICRYNRINNDMQKIYICTLDNPEISSLGHCKSSKNKEGVKRCPNCKGVGTARGHFHYFKQICEQCNGLGYVEAIIKEEGK